MTLTDKHLEAIRAAALPVEYGSVTVKFAETGDYLDLIVESRQRLSKEPEKANSRPPLLARRTDK